VSGRRNHYGGDYGWPLMTAIAYARRDRHIEPLRDLIVGTALTEERLQLFMLALRGPLAAEDAGIYGRSHLRPWREYTLAASNERKFQGRWLTLWLERDALDADVPLMVSGASLDHPGNDYADRWVNDFLAARPDPDYVAGCVANGIRSPFAVTSGWLASAAPVEYLAGVSL